MSSIISKIDYKQRIDKVLSNLNDHCLLLLSQPESYRNANVENLYRQDANLFYLTGFQEPGCALLIAPHRTKGSQVIFFLRDKDFQAELWTGRRLGIQAGKDQLAVDDVLSIDSLWTKLPEFLEGSEGLYFDLGKSEVSDRQMIEALGATKRRMARKRVTKLAVRDPAEVMGPLRLIKTAEEVERMRRAAEITNQTFRTVYHNLSPQQNERQVHAQILERFLSLGAEMEAYGSIVAGGVNACILHYRDNNQPLKAGELLLIDAGSQFEYYASDVTRTLPISKKFSPEQRALYEIVYDSQAKAIAKAVPGESWQTVHQAAVDVLVDGLIDLKLLTASRLEIMEKFLFRKFYPHGTSHWIGLDVHDHGDYSSQGKPIIFEPGMYFSVEPGLYIDPSYDDVDTKFRGIGIRIEDDVLITAKGNDVITGQIPKKISDLEVA